MKQKMKDRIKKSLVNLLDSEPFESLTVSSLCKNAAITRASFYKYYKNTADVLCELKEDFFSKIDFSNDVKEVYLSVLKEIKNNIPLVVAFFKSNNPVFREKTPGMKTINSMFEERIMTAAKTEEEGRFLFNNFKVACSAILFNWVQNGCKEDEKLVADYIIGRFLS